VCCTGRMQQLMVWMGDLKLIVGQSEMTSGVWPAERASLRFSKVSFFYITTPKWMKICHLRRKFLRLSVHRNCYTEDVPLKRCRPWARSSDQGTNTPSAQDKGRIEDWHVERPARMIMNTRTQPHELVPTRGFRLTLPDP
jgi:hypothetical protein